MRKSGADGAQLLVTPASILTLVPHLYDKPMYQSLQDFVTLGHVCDHSLALSVNGASAIRMLADYIRAAQAQPEAAHFATAGTGTGMHLLGTLFSRETGVKLTYVPY